MTFREIMQSAKDKGCNISDIETTIVDMMLKEGFTKEQIYSMSANRVYSLWLSSYFNEFEKIFSQIGKKLEENPQSAINAEPILKKMIDNIEKGLNELEHELNEREQKQKDKEQSKDNSSET
jgi:hypothetical protein